MNATIVVSQNHKVEFDIFETFGSDYSNGQGISGFIISNEFYFTVIQFLCKMSWILF